MPPADDDNQDEVVEQEEVEQEEGATEDGEGESEESEDEGSEEEEEGGLSKAEMKEAKYLYGLLRDKNTAPKVISALAKQAGINLSNIETKADVKEAKKDIKALVTEKLGPEMAFLAPKLAEIFEAALENERQFNTERLNNIESNDLARETTSNLERLARETKGDSRKVQNKMYSLMDSIHPSANLSNYEYLKMLYTIAADGKKTVSASQQMADRINRNRTNSAERLGSRSSTGKEGKPAGPAGKGLDNAVKYAMKTLGLD